MNHILVRHGHALTEDDEEEHGNQNHDWGRTLEVDVHGRKDVKAKKNSLAKRNGNSVRPGDRRGDPCTDETKQPFCSIHVFWLVVFGFGIVMFGVGIVMFGVGIVMLSFGIVMDAVNAGWGKHKDKTKNIVKDKDKRQRQKTRS